MKVLITGGAGFIGTNLSLHHLRKGNEVLVLDNLHRDGTGNNLDFIREQFPEVQVSHTDIRQHGDVVTDVNAFRPDLVIHQAGQVAVTTSVTNPREDFELNALGTFNVLEAVRLSGRKTPFIFASTNKVYGKLGGPEIVEEDTRYAFAPPMVGVSEDTQLDFYSPYGCSKGVADQYVHDYHRIYDIPTVVMRQSCIYGEYQYGIEDQGWVAWFCIAAMLGKPITVYGNGKQVRDLLHIQDLIAAYDAVFENIDATAGQVFNAGGGPTNNCSILDLLEILKVRFPDFKDITTSDWRPGDQKIYTSDISKLKNTVGWEPKIGVNAGIERLINWIEENRAILEEVIAKRAAK